MCRSAELSASSLLELVEFGQNELFLLEKAFARGRRCSLGGRGAVRSVRGVRRRGGKTCGEPRGCHCRRDWRRIGLKKDKDQEDQRLQEENKDG